MLFPRSHPAPMETCGAVADFDRVERQADASGARRRRRTRTARCTRSITGLPEHQIRVISPDVGGGFGNKVPVYPGYVCAIAGAMLLGRPVKWMEDRSENLMSTGFARDYAMTGPDRRRRATGSILAVGVDVIADHGAFNADRAADAATRPGSSASSPAPTTSPAAHCRVTGVYTNKAPGGVAYACSFRIAEAVYLVERMRRLPGARARAWTRSTLRLANLLRPEQFPYESKTGWVYDSGDYERGAAQGARARRLRRAARASRRRKRERGELMGIGVSLLHRGRRRRPAQAHGHARAGHERRRGAAHVAHRHGAARRSACRPRARATRRRSRRSSPRSWASRPRTSTSSTATPTRRPTGSAPTGRARRR